MPTGAPGKEEFTDAIMVLRNRHISVALTPLFTMREELVTNDEFSDRTGFSDITRDFLIAHLIRCDQYRRRITFNPDGLDLGTKIATAIDAKAVITDSANPFGGDDIQMPSGGLYTLPWALDGSDANIPLGASLNLQNSSIVLLLAMIDMAVVAWTRLNSRDRTMFITAQDSMRIYGCYQQVLAILQTFGGDKNRVDMAQVRATSEPRGPANAPNRIAESNVSAFSGSQAVAPTATGK